MEIDPNEVVPEDITAVLDEEPTPEPEPGNGEGIVLEPNPDYVPEDAPASEPAEEEWKPDYKIKVMDSEYEIDESLRGAITKENYDHIKELHEKAYGLDEVKKKREVEKERFSEVSGKYSQQSQAMAQMGHYLKNKDYTNLFSQLKISNDDVIEHALAVANYQELPPEKKQEYDRQVETQNQLYELQMQNSRLQQQQGHVVHQNRMNDVDSYISSSQMSDFVNEFDSRAGKPGQFAEEVRKRGEHAWYTTGKDIPVQSLVDEYAGIVGYTKAAPAQAASPAPGTPASGKPTLPIVKGSARSPAKRLPGSLADLEKMAESLSR